MIRIMVTGSRDWLDRSRIFRELDRYVAETRPEIHDDDGRFVDYDYSNVTLVVGDCERGADAMAIDWANTNFVNIERHDADWHTHGIKAGHIRNSEMVKAGADVCLAFIKDNSRGASSTANRAERAGIPTRRFYPWVR